MHSFSRAPHGVAFAAVLSWAVSASAFGVAAQEAGSDEGRWEFGGVPAINFDSDEGFGYGVVELYRSLSTPVRHSWELIREQSPVS